MKNVAVLIEDRAFAPLDLPSFLVPTPGDSAAHESLLLRKKILMPEDWVQLELADALWQGKILFFVKYFID